MPWVYNPHAGGKKIPPAVQERTRQRIAAFAERECAGKFTRLDIRFRGVFCYISAFTEPPKPTAAMLKITGETRAQFADRLRSAPLHLCRLRYFAEDRWSMAYYSYSSEKYEPCYFDSGKPEGTPEEAFASSATVLD